MLKDNLPVCPYCGRQLKYTEGFFIHKKGEYYCDHCGNVSGIEYVEKFKYFSLVLSLISVVLCILFFIIGKVNLFEVIVVIIPFCILYYFVPYFIVLKDINTKEYVDEQIDEEDDDDTKRYKMNKTKKIKDDDFDDMEITKILSLNK